MVVTIVMRLHGTRKHRNVLKSLDQANSKVYTVTEGRVDYSDLQRCGSFNEVQKFNLKHRATIYRYKERFKQIGITESNLVPPTFNGIPGAPLDLRDYHTVHLFNRHFLTKNTFLDMI